MPDKTSSTNTPDEGKIVLGGNTQETSQAEGSEDLGETDRKVGRTPGQAEGTDNPDDQNKK